MNHGACRALAAVLLVAASLPLAESTSFAQEPSPTPALRGTSTVTYAVRPPNGRMRVSIVLRLENTGTERSGREWGPIYVEDGANRIRVTTDQGTVSTAVTDVPGPWKRVDLKIARIPPGENRLFRLDYALKGGAPRSADPFRLGPGAAYFCVIGQPTDRGTIMAKLPRKYDPTYSGSPMAQDENQPPGNLTSGIVDDPLSHFTCIRGTSVDDLETASFEGPDGREVVLQAWPEDAQWLTPAKTFASRALPQLREAIGQPIPGSDPIVMRETGDGIGGYAGVHDDGTVVELSESLDGATIDHQLSHAWFGAKLFPEPWAREGLASWLAASIGGLPCALPDGGPAGLDLGDWQVVKPTSPEDIESIITRQEEAACGIAATMAQAMGPDQMRVVLGSLLNEEQKYVGSGAPARVPAAAVVDWREWLDAMDERGLVPAGVTDLDLAQKLLADYGVADDAALLQQRSEARAAYHALLDRAAPLAAPAVVRTAMDEWRFDDAQAALAIASEVLDALSTSDTLLPEAGLVRILQPRFEGAATVEELAAVKDEAASLLQQADAVVGPLTELRGITDGWGWTVPAIVDQAITAGDFDAAGTALAPALAVARDLAAAETALPDSPIHGPFQARFEAARDVTTLESLAGSVASIRKDAETTGVELDALRSESGEWKLPAAVTTPLAAGQVGAALDAIRDARATVGAVATARTALPEADVPSVIRPDYESATTKAQLEKVAAEAVALRDQAVATGAGLDKLRASVPGWTLPAVFGDSIRERDFATAQEAITTGQAWVDFAIQADSRIAGLGALAAQKAPFEAASSVVELEAGRVVAERQAQAVEYVADALQRKNDPRDLLTQVGLLGTDLNEVTDSALQAARDGDVPAATSYAAQLNKALTEASRSGGLRLSGLVFLGVALLGVIGLWVVLRRERKPPWARTSKPPWAR